MYRAGKYLSALWCQVLQPGLEKCDWLRHTDSCHGLDPFDMTMRVMHLHGSRISCSA
jgi:hypothetical protein